MSKTFIYVQDSGAIYDETGSKIAFGWAGNHAGRNNPDMQTVPSVGPLPIGLYDVGPWGDAKSVPGYPAHLGPLVASLTQVEGQTFGRSGFYLHGPGGADPANCSHGCIVIPRAMREVVAAALPDQVRVVATTRDVPA